MAENYNPREVNVIVDGTFLTGYQDGTMVSCAKNSDRFSMNVGAQGDATFVESADDTGQITVTLKHTSPSAPFLYEQANSREPFPVQVIDANVGNFKAGGTQCLIQRKPDSERGKEISGLEFVFLVADYDTEMN